MAQIKIVTQTETCHHHHHRRKSNKTPKCANRVCHVHIVIGQCVFTFASLLVLCYGALSFITKLCLLVAWYDIHFTESSDSGWQRGGWVGGWWWWVHYKFHTWNIAIWSLTAHDKVWIYMVNWPVSELLYVHWVLVLVKSSQVKIFYSGKYAIISYNIGKTETNLGLFVPLWDEFTVDMWLPLHWPA